MFPRDLVSVNIMLFVFSRWLKLEYVFVIRLVTTFNFF